MIAPAMKKSDTVFVQMMKAGLEHLLMPFDLRVESMELGHQFHTDRTYVGAKVWHENNCIFVRTSVNHEERAQLPMDEVATRCVLRLLKQLVTEEELKEAVADELLPPTLLDHLAGIEQCL